MAALGRLEQNPLEDNYYSSIGLNLIFLPSKFADAPAKIIFRDFSFDKSYFIILLSIGKLGKLPLTGDLTFAVSSTKNLLPASTSN